MITITILGVAGLLVWHTLVSRPVKPMDRLLTAPPLPPAREDLAGPVRDDWPPRQTPTDLAAAYDFPPVIPGTRAQSPVNPEGPYIPRHRAHGDMTVEFTRIMRTEYPGLDVVPIGDGGRALFSEVP